ncbi:MAG: xylose isomerase [Methanoculleus sp. SDB]|nr:MAG: xylose isomerase [Methanoculleus sp. SDB]
MFGVSTHCLSHEPLEKALELLVPVTGIVEIMDDGCHFCATAEPLESYSFEYFLHAPARGVNIASTLEPIRRASVEVIGQAFTVAGEVDADVVIHPGYYTWVQEREAAIGQMQQSLGELTRYAEECGITFFVENMPEWHYFFLRSPDELPLIGGLGLALDVGHAHLNGCLDAFLECPISHFHLHDNDGTEDSHVAVGDGTIDFTKVLTAVSKNSAIPVIEVGTLDGVLASIDRLGLHR